MYPLLLPVYLWAGAHMYILGYLRKNNRAKKKKGSSLDSFTEPTFPRSVHPLPSKGPNQQKHYSVLYVMGTLIDSVPSLNCPFSEHLIQ